MRVLLVSTYELGRQPFGLASPAAWLRERGHAVTCADLAVDRLPVEAVREAEAVAFHLPMHTATRLAVPVISAVRRLNPAARLAGYGLYAPLNRDYLHSLGLAALIGGEFEQALVEWIEKGQVTDAVSLDRLAFRVPDRTTLPVLSRYAALRQDGTVKAVAYTEASRGCKHLCRHCPVVPVYGGRFRIVPVDVVLQDVRQQVAAGARHVTFGDPDFLNGPAHAVRIIESMHGEFPGLTYDATIKVEHLRQHLDLLPTLRRTGCLFITTAVESLDDAVLARLEKGHTRADFLAVVEECRRQGLALAPTFIPFTPWTTREAYSDLLAVLSSLDLVEHVSPVQLALRLLLPANSRLLELPDIQAVLGPFDPAALLYRWRHPDPSVDALAADALRLTGVAQRGKAPRRETFAALWRLVQEEPWRDVPPAMPRATVPYLDEPWYC